MTLICYDEILKEKKRSFSRQTSVLDFLKSSSGTRVSPPVLVNTGCDDPDDRSTFQKEVSNH